MEELMLKIRAVISGAKPQTAIAAMAAIMVELFRAGNDPLPAFDDLVTIMRKQIKGSVK